MDRDSKCGYHILLSKLYLLNFYKKVLSKCIFLKHWKFEEKCVRSLHNTFSLQWVYKNIKLNSQKPASRTYISYSNCSRNFRPLVLTLAPTLPPTIYSDRQLSPCNGIEISRHLLLLLLLGCCDRCATTIVVLPHDAKKLVHCHWS